LIDINYQSIQYPKKTKTNIQENPKNPVSVNFLFFPYPDKTKPESNRE